MPCKWVIAPTIININLLPFLKSNACAWFSHPHFLKKSDKFCIKEILLTCNIQKISKGFHPYQSSLVNTGFNMLSTLFLVVKKQVSKKGSSYPSCRWSKHRNCFILPTYYRTWTIDENRWLENQLINRWKSINYCWLASIGIGQSMINR